MSGTDPSSLQRHNSESPTLSEPHDADMGTDPNRVRRRRIRDKPQLSCNACRKRKVRCDRTRPCSNCASRGQASSCAYTTEAPKMPAGQVQDMSDAQERITKLESLVRDIMQQQTITTPRSHSDPSPPDHVGSPVAHMSHSGLHVCGDGSAQRNLNLVDGSETPSSPEEEPGALKMQGSGLKYVSSAHWAAVLDGIAGLKEYFDQQDRSYALPPSAEFSHVPNQELPGPQLLYFSGWLPSLTKALILESVPPRNVVDRLVSRYFNAVVTVSGFPHGPKFRREYDEFWESPEGAPIVWIGLLFAMMCLSSQCQPVHLVTASEFASVRTSPSYSSQVVSESQQSIDLFHERTVQCLLLGQYTNGGPYVLETLLLYLMTEFAPSKDTHVGIRLLVGIIVQIAMHMGYHRDGQHFPNLSPFEGEMRRRVWALIYQIDFGTSTQMGLPRLLIRSGQIDTAAPRNLADSDFDEHSTKLPPSRPDTEVTPALYSASKLRLFTVGVKAADLACEAQCPAYVRVLELDQQLDAARESLPSSMRWTSLASCLTDSSQVILQRIFLEVCFHRIKITLHKRFQVQHDHSRLACLAGAMAILRLQHLIDEETHLDGRLYQSRWGITSAFTHDFLLATSILCFHVRAFFSSTGKGDSGAAPVEMAEVKRLLGLSRVIWMRESAISREAQRASQALRYVLNERDPWPTNDAGEGDLGMGVPDDTAALPDFLEAGHRPDIAGPFVESNNLNDGLTWQMLGQNLNSGPNMWTGFGAW